MITVNSHAAPKPTIKIQSNHDCPVGSGACLCHRSKANAAAMDTAHCRYCIGRE